MTQLEVKITKPFGFLNTRFSQKVLALQYVFVFYQESFMTYEKDLAAWFTFFELSNVQSKRINSKVML